MSDREYADHSGRTFGQRLDDDYQALLRVARAAKEKERVYEVIDGTTVGTVFDMWFASNELEEALKALLEGLL